MTTADRIAAALRAIAPEGKLLSEDVPLINQIAANWDARMKAVIPGVTEPAWVAYGKSKLGQREIKGPKHNSWIAKGWAKLGAGWFNDDETPWCGFFVADCLNAAGLPYPKNFPAAASFRTYGVAVPAQIGAIGTMKRPGGNHVFIIVGETPDRLFYKGLGGNQSDAVTIMDIRKSDVDAIRWPPGIPIIARSMLQLPVMPKGTVIRNMA